METLVNYQGSSSKKLSKGKKLKDKKKKKEFDSDSKSQKKRKKRRKEKKEKKRKCSESEEGIKHKKSKKRKRKKSSESNSEEDLKKSKKKIFKESSSSLHVMRPMTQAEYMAQQSIVRRVVDPETGRSRLIKGDGEILEEIVSRERHLAINKLATKSDGNSFQVKFMKLEK